MGVARAGAADGRRARAHPVTARGRDAAVPGVHDRRGRARARSRASSSSGSQARAPHRPTCWTRSSGADAIVIGPSNPVASIGPILALPGMREALARGRGAVVAVSPFVGGQVLKGPTLAFCQHAGIEPTAAGIADAYAGLLDGDRGRRAGDRTCLRRDGHADGRPRTRRARGGASAPWSLRALCTPLSTARGRRYSRPHPTAPDAHHRDPPVKSLGAAKQRLVEHARQRLAPGAGPGDVLRRAGRAAPRRGHRGDRGGHRRPGGGGRRRGRRRRGCSTTPRRPASPRPRRSASATRSPRATSACCSCPATPRCSTRSSWTACSSARARHRGRRSCPTATAPAPTRLLLSPARRRSSRASARAASSATWPRLAPRGLSHVVETLPLADARRGHARGPRGAGRAPRGAARPRADDPRRAAPARPRRDVRAPAERRS